MPFEIVDTEIFDTYPEAQCFIDHHNAQGRGCVVTNCNDGFLVDVYEEQPNI